LQAWEMVFFCCFVSLQSGPEHPTTPCASQCHQPGRFDFWPCRQNWFSNAPFKKLTAASAVLSCELENTSYRINIMDQVFWFFSLQSWPGHHISPSCALRCHQLQQFELWFWLQILWLDSPMPVTKNFSLHSVISLCGKNKTCKVSKNKTCTTKVLQ